MLPYPTKRVFFFKYDVYGWGNCSVGKYLSFKHRTCVLSQMFTEKKKRKKERKDKERKNKEKKESQAWWLTLVIPVWGLWRQADDSGLLSSANSVSSRWARSIGFKNKIKGSLLVQGYPLASAYIVVYPVAHMYIETYTHTHTFWFLLVLFRICIIWRHQHYLRVNDLKMGANTARATWVIDTRWWWESMSTAPL